MPTGTVARPDLRTRIVTLLTKPLDRPVFYKLAGRLQERRQRKLPDNEIRQLTALRAAYQDSPGPDVLMFGDSAMFWTRPGETDPRSLGDLIQDELGRGVGLHTIVGPGYNPRVVMAFLHALKDCPSRPKIVVVPTSLMMAGRAWLRHPSLAYEVEGAALREIIDAGEPYPAKLPRPTDADWDRYDRLPAASFSGAKRTYGEIRIILNAIPATKLGLPTTKWQQLVRVRALLELANAERLEPETVGVQLVGEAAAMLADLNLPALAYIPPVNLDVIGKLWNEKVVEHVERNASVIEAAFRSTGGPGTDIVNAVKGTPANEFSDPAHLNEHGRHRFAALLSAEIRKRLA